MSKKVFCKKYQKEMIALSLPPMPGPKGVELQNSVSQEAWDKWKSHQTTLINEKHLDLSLKENRKWLNEQMELFLSGDEYAKPTGFKPVE